MDNHDSPQGFILSEAAIYAYNIQDVYHDLISFAAAIPDGLKPLFLIPVRLEQASEITRIASRLLSHRYADGIMPTGDTDAAEMFGTQTFVCYDSEPLITNTDPGSIFEIDDGWSGRTKHQDVNLDQNIQVPTDTTFMEDVDITQYQEYPYRTKEKPVRKSSIQSPRVVVVRLAIKPEKLIPHTPDKIRKNAESCEVSLVSYDKKRRVYTFSVDSGRGPHKIQASLSDIDHIALNCDCPFWRWNGPEFHAKTQKYLMKPQHGTAAPPDVRDPDRKYWLCKHTYAVLRRLDSFVQQIVDENWELDDKDLLKVADKEWDRLEGTSKIALEDIEDEDPKIITSWDAKSLESDTDPDESEDESEESEDESEEPSV